MFLLFLLDVMLTQRVISDQRTLLRRHASQRCGGRHTWLNDAAYSHATLSLVAKYFPHGVESWQDKTTSRKRSPKEVS